MQHVTDSEIETRLVFDNPWWERQGAVDPEYRNWPRRAYFDAFFRILSATEVRRSIVLMGPRRVGKTVMILQTIQALLDLKKRKKNVFYASLDTPTYSGLSLEKLLSIFIRKFEHKKNSKLFVFFDEIQYHKDWEIHLKSLVDSYPNVRFVASGSAAAALKLKSQESGAGRFTDFVLPPLVFSEYLRFSNKEDQLIDEKQNEQKESFYIPSDIDELNQEFIRYLNYGGYPEAVFSSTIRNNSARYIRSDIIEKVLLRDLPSLYGVSDVQELNRLFTTLAYNTGSELSLQELSQSSGVAKNTLKRYIEYLEAAYLVFRLQRIDRNARRFKRAVTFKSYLTNPSMHAALFGEAEADSQTLGRLGETAVVAQLAHSDLAARMYYARWNKGEVDLVIVDDITQRPTSAFEIKWSNRHFQRPRELQEFVRFCLDNGIDDRNSRATTRSTWGSKTLNRYKISYMPTSFICYLIGKMTVEPVLGRGIHPHKLTALIEATPAC